MNFSPCLSVLNGRIDQTDLSPCSMLILTMSIIIIVNFPVSLFSISLRLSLQLYVSTPCNCIVLWFWITPHYIVTLPEVCHYGSSMSVGKWTCCGMANFNFPRLQLSLSNLGLASIILLPPCGSLWQPANTISLIIGIIRSSFAFDCKTINAQMCWWLTCDLSHQLTSETGLFTSPLRLFGPQGSGSGVW